MKMLFWGLIVCIGITLLVVEEETDQSIFGKYQKNPNLSSNRRSKNHIPYLMLFEAGLSMFTVVKTYCCFSDATSFDNKKNNIFCPFWVFLCGVAEDFLSINCQYIL